MLSVSQLAQLTQYTGAGIRAINMSNESNMVYKQAPAMAKQPDDLLARLRRGRDWLKDREESGKTGAEYEHWLTEWLKLLAAYEAACDLTRQAAGAPYAPNRAKRKQPASRERTNSQQTANRCNKEATERQQPVGARSGDGR